MCRLALFWCREFYAFLLRLTYTVVRLIRFLFLHLEKLIGEVVPDVRRLYFLLILLAYTPAMFRSDPFGSLVVVVIIGGGLAGFTWALLGI